MFSSLKRNQTAGGTPEFLIVGLGNPDKKYEHTRHNSGFLCVDKLAKEEGFSPDRLKYKSLYADAKVFSHRCIILKPQTYMNLSGEAVKEAASFYKIPPERILVIFDDISLDVGKMRIRRKGSHGGHNGIKSIVSCIGSSDFPRIKIGVGKKPHPDYDLADWVLSNFTKQEDPLLDEALSHACAAISLILDGKIDEAMNRYNA